MPTTKKSDADPRQLYEAALETVRLQRPSISPQEQRALADNLVNSLLGASTCCRAIPGTGRGLGRLRRARAGVEGPVSEQYRSFFPDGGGRLPWKNSNELARASARCRRQSNPRAIEPFLSRA